VLSVTLWYHFAFLVVSTAMLGFGFSGVILTLSRRVSSLSLERGTTLMAAGQALFTLLGFGLANLIPFAPFSLLEDTAQLFWAPLYLLCIAAPFVFSGLTAALMLTRLSSQAGRVYFFDLLGAGIGCVLVIVVLPTGGSSSVGIAAALAALGALLFSPRGRLRYAMGVLLLGSLGFAIAGEHALPLRISHTKTAGKLPMDQVLRSAQNLHTAWDSASRVDVLPSQWGRSIVIDAGTAMTRLPRVTRPPAQMGPPRDERALVLAGAKKVLIIGSGGGWEVLAALRAGAERVVAVEINPLINHLVSDKMANYVGNIFSDPRVELYTAEARSFIRRRPERFDVIMASHTISNAAATSGALSLSENYTLTLEAFEDYFTHLKPHGMLWFTRPEVQLGRLASTLAATLRQRGAKAPGHHVILFAGGKKNSFYGGIIASPSPFPPAFIARALATFRAKRLRPLYLPGYAGRRPLYRQVLESAPCKLVALYEKSTFQLRPTTDDKPFFNQRHRWSAIHWGQMKKVFKQGQRGRMALEDQPIAEVVLVVVLVQASFLALLFVVLPLLWRKRMGLAGASRHLLYFLALGLGFILVEISLIQRFTLFVGQPSHTFATVVGGLLVASGVGSWISQRWVREENQLIPKLRWVLVLVAIALVLFAWVSPVLMRACLGLALPLRVLVAVLMLTPLGLLMGMPFPLGLRHAGIHVPAAIPWAWGLNAVAGVIGSVAAIMLATSQGFSRVLVLAAVIYGLAALLWLGGKRQDQTSP